MNPNEFKEKVDTSIGLKMIVAGLAGLVDDEGYTASEALELLEATKNNTFHALADMQREGKQ